MGTIKMIQIISEHPVPMNVRLDTLLSLTSDSHDRKAITSRLRPLLPIPAWIIVMMVNGKMTIIENVPPAMQIEAPVLARTRIIVSRDPITMQKL